MQASNINIKTNDKISQKGCLPCEITARSYRAVFYWTDGEIFKQAASININMKVLRISGEVFEKNPLRLQPFSHFKCIYNQRTQKSVKFSGRNAAGCVLIFVTLYFSSLPF